MDDIRLRDSLELFPAYGSVVDRLSPLKNGLPTFVSYPYVIRDGAITPGQHASFLGKAHDPLLVTGDPNSPDFKLPQLSLPENLTPDRLANRRGDAKADQPADEAPGLFREGQGLDAYYERALSMLNSTKVREAFDLSQEPEQIRSAYGRTTYGQGCLLPADWWRRA